MLLVGSFQPKDQNQKLHALILIIFDSMKPIQRFCCFHKSVKIVETSKHLHIIQQPTRVPVCLSEVVMFDGSENWPEVSTGLPLHA